MHEALEKWVSEQVPVLEVTEIRRRPWAEVWRVESVDGLWWLKVNSAATGYEAPLLAHLARTGWPLLAKSRSHPVQPWALIADVGRSARDLLADAEPGDIVAFWCEVMPRYGELQRSLSAAELISLGVPDYSPDRLVEQFDQLVADTQWFSPDWAPEYSTADHQRVIAARPRLAAAAVELANGIPASIQHDDLHDGNVFSAAGAISVIDWGDAIVAHPFSTLRVTLDVLAHQLRVDLDAPELQRVTDAYLEVWRTGGESDAGLRHQLDLALRTASLGRAAGWVRALGTPEAGRDLDFADAVAHWTLRLSANFAD